MSLYPGGRENGQYSVSDTAMAQSMAKLMEDEFAAVYQAVKGSPPPADPHHDLRLLFVAVARGVLRYLNENENGNIVTQKLGLIGQLQVFLAVNLEKA